MTCKANLHRGAKLGKIVDRLLQVVKLPHFLNFGPHTCLYRPNKKNMFHHIVDLPCTNKMDVIACKHTM